MKFRVWFAMAFAIVIAISVTTLTVWKAVRPTLHLRACFHGSAGLQAGAAVRVNGVDAGKVRSIAPSGPDCPVDVELTLPLTRDFGSLPRSAVAEILTDGVLGPSYVEINLPPVQEPPLADHGTIQTMEYTGSLDPKTAEKLKKFANDVIDKATAKPLEHNN